MIGLRLARSEHPRRRASVLRPWCPTAGPPAGPPALAYPSGLTSIQNRQNHMRFSQPSISQIIAITSIRFGFHFPTASANEMVGSCHGSVMKVVTQRATARCRSLPALLLHTRRVLPRLPQGRGSRSKEPDAFAPHRAVSRQFSLRGHKSLPSPCTFSGPPHAH